MLAGLENISIQRMTQDDIEEIARLEKLCFSDPWAKQNFQEELKHRFSVPLVVKSGQTVLGYMCLWHIEDQMEIANFAVSPDFRGRGIGKKMMEKVLWEAEERGCTNLILSVRESNLPAIGLYTDHGFEEVHRRRGYYRDPAEDAIIMVKKLRAGG
ncbi:MAG: ribosomal protein S18-alanine N-acetyltransferase [Candidatus Zixiibacteriota bacterium]|nr:MAG: ribosomal protein S18-alanine N-acetyltransferase [candidate division Zixibacteria bacterium]